MSAPTAADKRRFAILSDYGCIVCRQPGEIHHIRTGLGMGQRDHQKTICLCEPGHHRNGPTSYHRNRLVFEQEHGTELELLEITNQIIGKIK